MKAITVNPVKKSVEVIDMPEPDIRFSNQVKLKMLDVGICGTDREICRFDYGTPPEGDDFLIIGHESLGEVIDTGASVKNFRTGDLAVLTVRRGCPENCISCENNEQDMCYTENFLECGIKGQHGFMREYLVEEERHLVAVPASLRSTAVLLEPLTIVEKALWQMSNQQVRLRRECLLEPGFHHYGCKNVLVLGAGPVGILAALAFAGRGFHTWVYSRGDNDSIVEPLLRKAEITLLPASDFNKEKIISEIGFFDLILEATGASHIAFEMMECLGPNGIYFLTGIPGRKHPFEFNGSAVMRQLVRKNQILIGSATANRSAFEHGVTELAGFDRKFPGLAPSIITSRVFYRDVIPFLHEQKKGELKTVITFS